MLKEFKQFLMRGNVVDLAVGIIIGTAFGKIVGSLVNDLIMPPLGLLLSRVDFRQLGWELTKSKDGKPILITYGNFLSSILDFLIVAVAIFLVVKAVNKAQSIALRKQAAAEPPPSVKACPLCCMDVPVKAVKCGHCTSDLG